MSKTCPNTVGVWGNADIRSFKRELVLNSYIFLITFDRIAGFHSSKIEHGLETQNSSIQYYRFQKKSLGPSPCSDSVANTRCSSSLSTISLSKTLKMSLQGSISLVVSTKQVKLLSPAHLRIIVFDSSHPTQLSICFPISKMSSDSFYTKEGTPIDILNC